MRLIVWGMIGSRIVWAYAGIIGKFLTAHQRSIISDYLVRSDYLEASLMLQYSR